MSRSKQTSSLSDVVDDRTQLREMRDFYLNLKRELGISSVKDIVPLSTQNDPVYLQNANIEKAEWFVDLWEKEGRPEFHARGFFYELLGKGYERPNGDPIKNSYSAWTDVSKGAKFAQILGLIPPGKVNDEKNPDPQLTVPKRTERAVGDEQDRWGWMFTTGVDVGYDKPRVPRDYRLALPELEHESAEEVLDHVADEFVSSLFRNVQYSESRRQPYYIEVWAEKGGLLPEGLLREYNATIRPAGGGEVSLSMCRDAVQRAEERGQGLVVVHVTDFDPKGADMPKSAARKIEVEAAARDVEAHVHHAALTAEQVERYGLPGEPGKAPEGDSHGKKAYESHKQMFRESGGYPVEVNAFESQEPQAFRDELERYIEPYYDDELGDRIDEAVANAKEIAREQYIEQADADAVADALAETQAAIEEYRDEMESVFEETKEQIDQLREKHQEVADEVGLSTQKSDLENSVRVTVADVVDSVESDWTPPEGEIGATPTPLLDTERPIPKQIEHYRRADIRYDSEEVGQ